LAISSFISAATALSAPPGMADCRSTPAPVQGPRPARITHDRRVAARRSGKLIHGTIHLFHNVAITEATVGQTLIANASTDSQFSAFAAFATNGRPNITHFDFITPGGIGSIGADSEAALFRLPKPAVDFHGFTLSSVQLQVNDFPLTTINGTTFRFLHGQLSVFGEGASQTVTPEPMSVMLLSIGAMAMLVRRRRLQTSERGVLQS